MAQESNLGVKTLATLKMDLNDNQRRFLSQVIRRPGSRRNELAEELGFSAQTAMRVVQPLIEAGIITESEEVTGTRGKPPRLAYFVKGSLLTVAVVLAPDRVTVGISDLGGHMLTRETERRVFSKCSEQLGAVKEMFARLSNGVPHGARVVWAGVTASGFFLERGRRIVSRVDPEGWASIDLREWMETLIGAPTVIENDARMIAASILQEEARRNFLCVYFDIRIGGAIVSNGQLFQGHYGNAGVIGRLFKDGENRPSERTLRRALSIDDWDNWGGIDTLDPRKRAVLENWLDDVGDQFTVALNSALALLDFEATYICTQIPQDIMAHLVKRIVFKPLGANLEDNGGRSFVMPLPEIVVWPAEDFAEMSHLLAARHFFGLGLAEADSPSAARG